jgi:hypothetical protein
MTISNQRLIFNMVKAGSIDSIDKDAVHFTYSSKSEQEAEAKMLQTAGYWVMSCKNNLMVCC